MNVNEACDIHATHVKASHRPLCAVCRQTYPCALLAEAIEVIGAELFMRQRTNLEVDPQGTVH